MLNAVKSYLYTILIIICAIVASVAVGFFIYQQQQMVEQQKEIENSVVEQKRLSDGIVRSMSQLVSKKDFDEFSQKYNVNMDEIRGDLQKLNARPSIITYVQTTTPGSNQTNIPSSSSQNNPNPILEDKYGYLKNIQTIDLNERFKSDKDTSPEVPIGSVAFDASKKAPWSISIYPRNYNNTTVIGKDENGRSYSYVRFAVDVNGKTYPVMINTSKMVEEYPSARFRFWDPRAFIGAQGGVNVSQVNGELPFGVSVGIMSYGKYVGSPDWSFLQPGVSYGTVSGKLMGTLTPAAYNIGRHLPLISNTYIASDVGVSTSGDVSVTAGVKVGL